MKVTIKRLKLLIMSGLKPEFSNVVVLGDGGLNGCGLYGFGLSAVVYLKDKNKV